MWLEPAAGPIIFIVAALIFAVIFAFFLADEIAGKPILIYGGCVLATLVCVNGAIFAFSSGAGSNMSRAGSYREAAESFGLHANEQYPLLIGGSAGSGTVGSADTYLGFFSAASFVDLKPTTTITLSFSHEGRSWIATIPTDLITFHREDDATPSVSIDLKPWSYGPSTFWDNEKTNEVMFANGALTNVYWFTRPNISLSEQGQREGLAPVINNGVTHVDIVLPDSLYRQVFNLQED